MSIMTFGLTHASIHEGGTKVEEWAEPATDVNVFCMCPQYVRSLASCVYTQYKPAMKCLGCWVERYYSLGSLQQHSQV